jgi:hypothetical protein
MNYSDMTDFEINKLVVKALGFTLMPDSYYLPAFKSRHPSSVWFTRQNEEYSLHDDYCNNPNDAWTIILESKIDLDWVLNGLCRAEFVDIDRLFDDSGELKDIACIDANPLRAAMIVYLVMNEDR